MDVLGPAYLEMIEWSESEVGLLLRLHKPGNVFGHF